jgi:hypothetical protein
LQLQETERLLGCSYCRVRHIIFTHPQASLHIPPRHKGKELIYAPYWRFKGTAFALLQGKVAHRIIDTTRTARPDDGVPFSLGLRVQTQPLRFVEPKTEGTFLAPELPCREVVQRMSSRLLGLGSKLEGQGLVQCHVGEVASLVFAPLSVGKQSVFDGLSGKRLEGLRPQALQAAQQAESISYPSFLPALCPYCGWDLVGARDSLVQFCSGCNRVWAARQGKLAEVRARFLPPNGKEKPLYLPFWELEVQAEKLGLQRRADLLRLANDVRSAGPQPKDGPAVCRIPAFKIRPGLFLRLASQMTLASGFDELAESPQRGKYYPVTLPQGEAVEALTPVVGRLAADKKSAFSCLAKERFEIGGSRLLFVPFKRQNPDYVQPRLNIGLPGNALFFARSM